jgi:hypothetical protein
MESKMNESNLDWNEMFSEEELPLTMPQENKKKRLNGE